MRSGVGVIGLMAAMIVFGFAIPYGGCAEGELTAEEAGAGQPGSSEEGPGEPITVKPATDYPTAVVDRIAKGVHNLVFAPVEIPNQLRQEIKYSDPVYGVVPGMFKGIGWGILRAVAGVFEIATFYAPIGPTLEPFNTDWVYA